MNRDIKNRKDIELFVNEFYDKLLADSSVKHFFEHIVKNNSLEHHINTITDFWNGILFNATDYQKNAMQPHLDLHQKILFKNEHFEIWLNHFNNTIDESFSGEKAELAKTRALSIATVMKIKMTNTATNQKI